MQKDPIVIVGLARTPFTNFLGALKDISATELGAAAIKAAVERASLPFHDIDEVIMGCVLSAGHGQAPARQAALSAGLPIHVNCTTINKMCGSGMKAVMFAHDSLVAGSANIIVAGGMESMTNAPYLLPKARQGHRFGHSQLLDHMLLDGLEDAYEKGQPMGYFAEQCVKHYGFTREEQDQYAITSFQRAQKATNEKNLAEEITPLVTKKITVEKDEHPFSVNLEKMPHLSSIFMTDGTVTAGNSSSIADGAAALVLMRLSEAEKRGIKPLARILQSTSHAKKTSEFTTAPIDATRKLLDKLNWQVSDVDLFEINEAFAVIVLAAMRDLKIPHEKMNIFGGACALGHPLGATGARIIITLISALRQKKLKRGIAALCIGGGEATAIAVEIL